MNLEDLPEVLPREDDDADELERVQERLAEEVLHNIT